MGALDRIHIIGAGPAGLGAAWRLQEHGRTSWFLAEAADTPGGLSASVVDDQGFTWDLGGHVLFSRYEYFNRVMDGLPGVEWTRHVRDAQVWMRDRFIPYPLQHNIRHLPLEEVQQCFSGLHEARALGASGARPKTFEEWLLRTFGRGLAEAFFLPYNRKVWAYEPAALDMEWVTDRVPVVDRARALENLAHQRDDRDWGPNACFRFPLRGGTGAVWRALFQTLPAANTALRRRATRISTMRRTVEFADGTTRGYDHLISTMPLDELLRALSDRPDLAAQAERFRHSSVYVVGVGVEGDRPAALAGRCWVYFPEPEVLFHRVTVLSNYSPCNVPEPGRQWSLLCEVSESAEKRVRRDTVAEDVLTGLRRVGLLPSDGEVVSLWCKRIEYAYPTPFLRRGELLASTDRELRSVGIWSRGRFGSWKYEVGNQDHSFMQGVEAVDHIVHGTAETTYHHPAAVNSGKQVPIEAYQVPRSATPAKMPPA